MKSIKTSENNNAFGNNSSSRSAARNGIPKDYDDDQRSSFARFRPLPAVVVFGAAVLCFANSYDGDFVFDDSEAIENNRDLLPSTPLQDLLYHDFWGRKLGNLSHKSYRPLTVLTFRWNYWFAGGLRSADFHIVNIFLHGIVCVMMLSVFNLILSGPNPLLGFWEMGASKWSFLCSLLFAVHPVHTESVAGIVGRADLLCALFFILSFLFYVRGSTVYSTFRPEKFSLLWLCLSVLCSGLATFSKEQGITVIGICSAYDILSICDIDIGSILGVRQGAKTSSPSNEISESNGTSSKKSQTASSWQLSLIKRQIFLGASGIVLLVVRFRAMGSSPPTFQVHDNPHSFVNGSFYRGLNYNYLYAINAWILLSPQWLCFDWSMGCVPTITSLADLRLFGVVALWLVMACLAWVCLSAESFWLRRTLTLAVAFLVIPYLPATNILFRVGFVVAERVLYLPSVGFCVLVVVGLQKLSSNPNMKMVATTGFAVLIVIYMARSAQRSNEWRHGMWLFKAGAKVCPLNAKVHYNIAKLNGDDGNNDVAISHYRLAIELNPVYDQAMNNLANILKDQNEELEAEGLLDRAVSVSPDFAAAWMNRGIVKAALKKYEESEYSYRQGIRCRKNYPDCYYNLGNLYIDMGRSQDALDAFRNATLLRPTHWNAWNNAVILMDSLGHFDQAVKLAQQALKELPNHSSILFSLANIYGKQAKYEESEKWFKKALKFDAQNPNIYQNLGVLYHRWGKYQEAETAYQRALQLKPGDQITLDNMQMLKAKMKQHS